ncbi:MAG: chromate resistance protein [Thermoprotei archaeon]|nr:MAG: chromate resistance protein [Thermoprotei archaeon]
MKWVTRSFPHVDRTASAWLIKRFIDPQAEFVFIDWPEQELRPEYGTPFDIKGVELGHRDGKCTFEVIVEKYSIEDPYVKKIAELVHAADIEGEIDKVPEARGIKALFSGLRLVTRDDYETLELGFKIWDAIYAYYKLRDLEEKHREELASMSRSERLRYLKKLLKE